jgi:hypothetical protein
MRIKSISLKYSLLLLFFSVIEISAQEATSALPLCMPDPEVNGLNLICKRHDTKTKI